MSKSRTAHPADSAIRAAKTAVKLGEAVEAAGSVIVARTEMAMLSCTQPSAETTAEMGLMFTEKMAAMSEASHALTVGAGELAGQGARYATGEFAAAGQGMMDLAACRSPMDLLQVQGRLMTGFLGRTYDYAMGAGATAASTGEDAVGPMHKAVTDNKARLDKRRP